MGQLGIGGGDGLRHRVDGFAVDLVAEVATVGRTFEPAPLGLQSLVGGDGVQHQCQGRGPRGEGLAQALGRRLAFGRLGVGQPIQGLSQRQALLADRRAQGRECLVE